jgi:mercuric ion binding protein
MNKTILCILIGILSTACASAQQQRPVSVRIATPGMQCNDCKMRVEDALKFEEGVVKFVAYPTSRYVLVTYLKDRTNVENIKTSIANAGYDADDVTANEESYRKLPTSCKKPEDGGTHKPK